MSKDKFLEIWEAIQTEALSGDLQCFLEYYDLDENDYKEFEKYIEAYKG